MDLKEHRRKVLRKLNFERTEGTKHEKWTLRDSSTSKVYVTTYVSRGNRDMGTGLIKAICSQLHITISQYRQIAACEMSRGSYYKHLIEKTDIA